MINANVIVTVIYNGFLLKAGKHQELEQRLIEEVNRKELASHTEPPAKYYFVIFKIILTKK